MGRGKNSNKNHRKQVNFEYNKVVRDVIRVSKYSATSNGTGVYVNGEVNMTPGGTSTLGTRFIAMCDLYAYWRLHSFSVRVIFPASTSNQIEFGFGWIPLAEENFTASTSASTFADFPYVKTFSSNTTVAQQFKIGPQFMNKQMKWFETNVGSGQQELYMPGVISTYAQALGTDVTSKFQYTLALNLEFMTPIDPALNPLTGIMRGTGIRKRMSGFNNVSYPPPTGLDYKESKSVKDYMNLGVDSELPLEGYIRVPYPEQDEDDSPHDRNWEYPRRINKPFVRYRKSDLRNITSSQKVSDPLDSSKSVGATDLLNAVPRQGTPSKSSTLFIDGRKPAPLNENKVS